MPRFSAKVIWLLRNLPGLKFVLARFSELLRTRQVNPDLVSSSRADAPEITIPPLEARTLATSEVQVFDRSEEACGYRPDREALIRRRWMETGVKMWNPRVHGSGKAALNIQGEEGVLPIKQGQVLPAYDELKFKLIGSCIVCEDVVVGRRESTTGIEEGGPEPAALERLPANVHGMVTPASNR